MDQKVLAIGSDRWVTEEELMRRLRQEQELEWDSGDSLDPQNTIQNRTSKEGRFTPLFPYKLASARAGVNRPSLLVRFWI